MKEIKRKIVNQYGWSLLITETHKECRKCKALKVHSDFHRDTSNKYGLAYWCKECVSINSRFHHAKRRRESPEYSEQKRNQHYQTKYGFSSERYDSMWVNQKVCAICKTPLLGGFQTHLDHSHVTGKLRKFLCTNCNRGLGHFKENPKILSFAIQYLEENQ